MVCTAIIDNFPFWQKASLIFYNEKSLTMSQKKKKSRKNGIFDIILKNYNYYFYSTF